MVILLTILLSFFVQDGNQIIHWDKNRKLTIDDFKKSPPKDVISEKAISGFSTRVLIEEIEDNNLKIIVEAVFFPLDSWFIGNSLRLLAHEQIHFDIAEITARKIRKAIIFNCEMEKTNDIKLVKEQINIVLEESREIHKRYDTETFHSLIEAKQIEWESKVYEILDTLNNYSNFVEIIISPEGKRLKETHCQELKDLKWK